MRIIKVYKMNNIWIFISIKYFKFINIDKFKVNDKYFESLNYFDWNIIILVINDYIFFEIIKYAWIYIYTRICNIIISIFDIKFIYEISFLKSQNSFFEIIQFFIKIILFIIKLNILYIVFELSYLMKIFWYIFIFNFF